MRNCGFRYPDLPCQYVTNDDWNNIKTCFAIFPTIDPNPENGTLENLCLDILADQNADNLISKSK